MYVRIALFIVAYIARLIFVKAYTKVNINSILKSSILPILIISLIVLGVILILWSVENPLIRLFIISPLFCLILLSLIFFIGFDKAERSFILGLVLDYRKKLFDK